MTLSKATMALITTGILVISAPAFAQTTNISSGARGGGGGENPLSSDRSNDLGVNPNYTYTGCYGQNADGGPVTLACPSYRHEQSYPYPYNDFAHRR